MKVSQNSQTALKTIQDAKSIGLVVSETTTAEAVTAALALYHLFSLMGKKTTPIVPGEIPDEVLPLPSSTEIKHDFGPKSLVVTLDTNKTPIKKVSYRAEGQKFQLIVHPMARAFEVENIHYAYEGLSFDLLVTLGVKKLSDLGELYEKNRGDFSGTIIVNFDVSPQNENYGQINIVDPSKSSVSELLFHQFLAWEITPSKEVAQCLLTGLASASPVIEEVKVPAERKLEKISS